MKKKFAFLLMGEHYDPKIHHAAFETARQTTYIYTVRNYDEAVKKVLELVAEGVGAIELCGAFGQEKAVEMAELTGNRIAIGYVTHHPDMDEAIAGFFSKHE